MNNYIHLKKTNTQSNFDEEGVLHRIDAAVLFWIDILNRSLQHQGFHDSVELILRKKIKFERNGLIHYSPEDKLDFCIEAARLQVTTTATESEQLQGESGELLTKEELHYLNELW